MLLSSLPILRVRTSSRVNPWKGLVVDVDSLLSAQIQDKSMESAVLVAEAISSQLQRTHLCLGSSMHEELGVVGKIQRKLSVDSTAKWLCLAARFMKS